jgi:hypothetical protein
MSFETDRRKLETIRNLQTDQQTKIERQETGNSLISRNIKRLAPNHAVFKKRPDISVDWQPMIHTVFNGSSDPDTQYIDWEIVLERFDERLISFINVEILYRVSDGSINDGADIESPSKIILFEVEDLPNETFIKKITLRASFYFSDGDIYLPYEAKLLVTLSHHQDNL